MDIATPNYYASSSQEAVRMMLYKFIDEVRTGRREDSVISTNSLSHEEQDSWRIVGKELEDVGITPQLFIENFGWIKETLQYSRESGALQEQPLATQQFSSEAESTEVISADYSIQEGTTVNDLSILSHEYPLTRKPISKTRNQNTAALVQQPSSHHSSASMPHTSDGNNSNNRTGLLSNRNLGEHLQQPMVYSFDCLFPGCSNNRGRGYVDSFNASRHNQRVHSGQRFSCTIFGCGNNYGKGFSCLLSRSRHIELVHSDTNTTSDTTQNAIAENHPSPDLKLQHGSLLSIRQKEVLNSTYENDRQLLNPKTSLSTDPQPHGSPKSSLTLSDQGSCLVQFGVVIEANSHLIDPALSELQNGSQALSFSNPDSFCQTMKEVGRSELTMDKALLSNVADNDMLSETCTSHQTKEDCEWFYCPREDCPRSKGGIGFTKSGYLAKHRPVHESRRYACPFCHSSDDPHLYPRRDSLRRHLRNSHRDKNNSQIQEALAFRMPPVELIISADGERNIDLVPQVTGGIWNYSTVPLLRLSNLICLQRTTMPS